MRGIVEETRADGHRVVRAKGYTDYAVAMSTALIGSVIHVGPVPFRADPQRRIRGVRGCLTKVHVE